MYKLNISLTQEEVLDALQKEKQETIIPKTKMKRWNIMVLLEEFIKSIKTNILA